MPYGTVNADKMTTSDGVSSSGLYGFKNRIINGAFTISQYNGTSSVTPSSDGYIIDRYKVENSQASKLTYQQNAGSVTPPVGFSNYLGATVASTVSIGAGDYFLISQPIEGYNVSDLGFGTANAKTVTLSFQVYSSVTGTFGGSLQNSANSRSYPFTYTVSSANTWTAISITIAGDTSGTWLTTNGIGLKVRFSLGTGSTYSGTAGSWAGTSYLSATGSTSIMATASATFYITGVQLEKGSTATSFDYRPYGTEFSLCQRYLTRFLGDDNNGGYAAMGSGYSASTTVATISHVLPVKMRSYPTVSYGGNVRIINSGASAAITSTSNIQMSNQNGYVVYAVASGLTAGYGALMGGNNDTTSYLQFSAEL